MIKIKEYIIRKMVEFLENNDKVILGSYDYHSLMSYSDKLEIDNQRMIDILENKVLNKDKFECEFSQLDYKYISVKVNKILTKEDEIYIDTYFISTEEYIKEELSKELSKILIDKGFFELSFRNEYYGGVYTAEINIAKLNKTTK